MTEYKTFDDYVKNTFNIEPRELTHISPEEQKKKTVAITVDELINIWNELTELQVEASRLWWHKVADGDLPREDKEYLVYMNDGTIDMQEICMNGNGEFYLNGISWNFSDVIAWCEIPQYTEE